MEQDQKILKEVWSDWDITEKLGEGTFGKVYKIKREYLGREQFAALKVINVSQNKTVNSLVFSLDDKSFVDEIVSEIELMSKFKGNSTIVSYEDHRVIENSDGSGWTILIRMELLTPLSDYLIVNEISSEKAIKIGIDICTALEMLNEHKIIHRDIKLENIFVSENGNFKLGDFGTARIIEKTEDNRTRTGTYMYMAPEVLKSEPYGAKADIYSLGVLLYYLTNHQRFPFFPSYPNPITFEDKKIAFNKRISGQELISPDCAEKNLAAIILKACEFESKNRFSSAYEMRIALESLLPKEKTVVLEPKQKRNKKGMIIAAAALLSVALIAGIAAAFTGLGNPDKNDKPGTVFMESESDNGMFKYGIYSDGIHITGLISEQNSLEIPEKIEGKAVISIDKEAFANRTFKTVSFPDTLKYIDDCAFINCINMESIVLPDDLKTIGKRAFENCSALKSVVLPEKLETLGDMAFKNCSVLVDINVPKSIINTGTEIFAYTPFKKNREDMAGTYSYTLSRHSDVKYTLLDIDGDRIEELLVYGNTANAPQIFSKSHELVIYKYKYTCDYIAPKSSSQPLLILDTPSAYVSPFGHKIYNDYDKIFYSASENCLYGSVYNDGYEEIHKVEIKDGVPVETLYQESKYVGDSKTVLGEEIVFSIGADDTSLLKETVMRGIIDTETTNNQN